MALLKLNGKLHFIDRDSVEVKPVSNGRWSVTVDAGRNTEETFLVVGGIHSGGARHEWFCHCPKLYGDAWVPTNSMIHAIKMGASF